MPAPAVAVAVASGPLVADQGAPQGRPNRRRHHASRFPWPYGQHAQESTGLVRTHRTRVDSRRRTAGARTPTPAPPLDSGPWARPGCPGEGSWRASVRRGARVVETLKQGRKRFSLDQLPRPAPPSWTGRPPRPSLHFLSGRGRGGRGAGEGAGAPRSIRAGLPLVSFAHRESAGSGHMGA